MIAFFHNIFELLSFFVAIFYYRYLKGTFMKWFLPFLGFIWVGEFFAYYQNIILKVQAISINYLIGIVESVFYGYIFYNLSQRVILKKAILLFIPVSVLGYFLTYLFGRQFFHHFISNIIISGFFIAAIALAYLYEKFADDDETLLVSEPGFWIAVGVSLFYSGISISFSLYNFIIKHDLSLFGLKLYKLVPRVLSVILYLCISISLILCKKKNKILS